MALRGQPRVVAASGELIEQTGSASVRQLALQLAKINRVASSLAHLAEVLPREEPLYLNSLANLIDSQGDKAIAGGGVWPEPNAFSEGAVRRSFFWARGADGRLSYSDDYNAADGPGYHTDAWYAGARSSKAGQYLWSEAYQDAVTGVPMATCSVPYQLEGSFAGVATLDLLLDDLARFLTEQGKVTDGYAFALDQAGNVLYSPNMTGAKGSAMVKFADLTQQRSWLKPVQNALNSSSSGAIRNLDLENDGQLKQASHVSLFVMPDTGWVIGLATPQQRVTGLARALT